jgi:hypothetical protein
MSESKSREQKISEILESMGWWNYDDLLSFAQDLYLEKLEEKGDERIDYIHWTWCVGD